MEIWLDSVNLLLIQKAAKMGILHGVTTNPAILAESDQIDLTIANLLKSQNGPITYQTVATSAEGMIEEGFALQQISARIIVKIPVTQAGLQAIQVLSQQGIHTMATVIFDYRQYLLSAKAGAFYAAPYYSSILKSGGNADQEIERMCKAKERYQLKTKILAASLQTLDQFITCNDLGVDAVTLKDPLFLQLVEDHPTTLERLEQFLNLTR